jgi:hypothetical protein
MTIKELKNQGCILMECVSGSRAYNLHTETSDTDIKGVYILPKNQYFGLNYIPQISNKTNDVVYYELGRFTELLLKNNPNILEMLASPKNCIISKHPILNQFNPKLFLSKLCKNTFANYALSQIKKARGLNKKINNPMDEQRKSILEFCYVIQENGSMSLKKWLDINNMSQHKCGLSKIPHCKGMYALYHDISDIHSYNGIMNDENANDVSLSSIPMGEKPLILLFCNVDAYSSYCREYREYWDWVTKRNKIRYQTNIELNKNYDAKNMMHTIRLLQMGKEIITNHELNVWRNNREQLLKIKNGGMEFDELMLMAEQLMNEIDSEMKNSLLPEKPDENKIENILIEMRKEFYK